MSRLLVVPLLAAAALVAAGCSVGGDPVTRERSLPAFDRIAVSGKVERLRVQAGPQPGAVVRAGDKVIDLVRTEVRGGTLRITAKRRGIVIGPSGLDHVRIDVTLPVLRELSVNSGDVTAEGIDADRLTVSVRNRGSLTVRGRVGTLVAEARNAADANLAGLLARDATVTAANAASLTVYARDTLDATARNAADVSYRGDPRVTEHVGLAADISRDRP